ncbi:hypothetical protein ACI2KR_30145 [Pseudomonas luteola]
MDAILVRNLKRFLENTETFFSLIQSYLKHERNQDDVISLLKTQHNFAKRALRDLGVPDDESDKTRSLHEQVRLLEREIGETSDYSFQSIARFIHAKEIAAKEYIRDYGLSFSLNISVSSSLSCRMSIYPVWVDDTSHQDLAKNEQEAREITVKHIELVTRLEEVFDTKLIERIGFKSYIGILYTDKNKTLFESLIAKALEIVPQDLQFQISIEGENNDPLITEISFTSVQLEQHRNMSKFLSRG